MNQEHSQFRSYLFYRSTIAVEETLLTDLINKFRELKSIRLDCVLYYDNESQETRLLREIKELLQILEDSHSYLS